MNRPILNVVCAFAALVPLVPLPAGHAAERKLAGYSIIGYDKETTNTEVHSSISKLINAGRASKIVVITGSHGDGTAGNLGDPTYPDASVAKFTREDIASINALSKGKNVTVTFRDISKYMSPDVKVREKKGAEVLATVSKELSANATVVLAWCYSGCWKGLARYGRLINCTP